MNGKDATRLQHSDIVEIVKRSGLRVTLTVVPGESIRILYDITTLCVQLCVSPLI